MDGDLDMEKDINLGIILDSTIPLQLSIPVKNRSDRVIHIQKIAKDCSCMAVKIDKRVLAPGETATLSVVTNLAGKSGLYMSDIVVESDAAEKIDEIQIRGQITGQIRVRPLRATILTGDKRAPGLFTVYCDDQDGKWNYAGFVANDPRLHISLKQTESTATTSVYEGKVDIVTPAVMRNYPAYKEAMVTLDFKNDHLDKVFKINLPVDIAARQKITVDPPQVLFLSRGVEQRRTLLVQSAEALSIDAARCSAPGIKASIHRLDAKAVKIDLDYRPSSAPGARSVTCELVNDDKTLAIVPITFVEIP